MSELSKDHLLSFVKNDPLSQLKEFSGKFLSIGALALFPERICGLLKSLEKSCFDVRNFEVNIAIPLNPAESPDLENAILTYKANSKLEIKIVKTPFDYWAGVHGQNKMIFETSSRDTYFYVCLSDRYRFSSLNWDLIIKQFIGAVPDDMFFLRNSTMTRNFKPRKNLHDAWYRPEHWGIYTRKYLEAISGFLPSYNANDASTEMVQYFIARNKKDPFVRDIILPPLLLNDDSNIISQAYSKKNYYIRYCKIAFYYYRHYFSKSGIESCKKAASKLYLSHFIWHKKFDGASIIEGLGWVGVKLSNGEIVKKVSFKVSHFFALRQKIISCYGAASGFNFAYKFYFLLKTKWGYNLLQKLAESDAKKRSFVSLFRFILSRVFFCEEIGYDVRKILKDEEFKEVIQGEEIAEMHRSKFYKVTIEELAKEQLKKSLEKSA